MLGIVTAVNAAKGAESWAEFDAEGAEIMRDSVRQVRELLDEMAEAV